MKQRLLALAIACLVPAVPAVLSTDAQAADAAAITNGQTYVVGDSLTYWGAPYVASLDPEWLIDGVPGRRVDTLPDLVDGYVAANGYPQSLVIALGTNPAADWSGDDYLAVIASLPTTTHVYLVTPYRDPLAFPARAATAAAYAKSMVEIAAGLENVTVIPWRHRVRQGRVSLRDGVHATHPEGEQYWALMVSNYVKANDAPAASRPAPAEG